MSEDIVILVYRAQSGDRDALGELFESFQRMVHATAMKLLHNEAEADELAQDVCIKAMNKIGQLRDPARFPGWLRQITHRLAINRIHRRKPVSSGEFQLLDAVAAPGKGPLASLFEAEDGVALHKAIARLKATDRATLEAFYFRGRSVEQMSGDFGVPVGTVKRRLHVARGRLKDALGEGERGGLPKHACVC